MQFGALCFNRSTEETILMVMAPKSDHASLDDFLDRAFACLESDPEFCDNWQEQYRERAMSPANEDCVLYIRSRLIEGMSHRINMILPPFQRAVHILPPVWNEKNLGVETASEYLFIMWATSA